MNACTFLNPGIKVKTRLVNPQRQMIATPDIVVNLKVFSPFIATFNFKAMDADLTNMCIVNMPDDSQQDVPIFSSKSFIVVGT